MIDELAAKVFADRDMAHMQHLRTDSYAEHVALGEFYEAVIPLVDDVIEMYQGVFSSFPAFQVQTKKVTDIKENLGDTLDWMQAMRDDISNGDSSIGNAIDTLAGCYQKTIYKLTRLK